MNPHIYTIPPHMSFVDELATGILQRFGDDPLILSKVTVLLPNLRSVRSLREAFLRATDGKPLLLPAMRAIGEVDELAMDFSGQNGVDIPPVVSTLKRRMLLADLIMQSDAKSRGEQPAISYEQAQFLAYDLAAFLDDVQTYQLDFAALENIVPEELSKHWQVTLEFLAILSQEWPRKLADLGMLDPCERKHQLVEKEIEYWQTCPLKNPFIIAGTTGSIPSTSLIIKEIIKSENGYLILPGLDKSLEYGEEGLPENHSQYGMRELLLHIGFAADDVRNWGEYGCSERLDFINVVMSSPNNESMQESIDLSEASVQGLTRLTLKTLHEEASVIALMLREHVELHDKTAALVTNDRDLAQRVSAMMRRWDIELDDSAGCSLLDTPVGVFMRLVISVVQSRFSPVDLLSLLKHPFCTFGLEPADANEIIREFEVACLRGVRPANGLEGVKSLPISKELQEFIALLESKFEPLLNKSGDKCQVATLVRAHIQCAENLAATAFQQGEERLWLGDEGEQCAKFLSELLDAVVDSRAVGVSEYPGLFESFFLGRKIRKSYGLHPRLHILSPIEARLQHFDLVVLGGLNQGSWPASVNNPWMSKPMCASFGLPSAARMTGLAAHDFVGLACAERVVLTRAEKIGGSPTIASPWLLRMDAALERLGWQNILCPPEPWVRWVELLSQPDSYSRSMPPAPTPPTEARPNRMSVTNIERWMRDPYSIYAKYILNLRQLDDVDQDAGAAEFGNILHEALEKFVNQFVGKEYDVEYENLLQCAKQVFAPYLNRPSVARIWWPRFESIAGWFVGREMVRQKKISKILTEVEGKVLLEADVPFTISAHADRIELSHTGEVSIIDYKTGVVPKVKEVELGISSQLSLEAVIAEAGGFENINGVVASVEYWKLAMLEQKPVSMDLKNSRALIENAKIGIISLINNFTKVETAYRSCPDYKRSPRYNEYAHLARIKEWSLEE